MAALPLIASAVGLLLPAIPNIVKAVEAIFGSGTGPEKLKSATDITQLIANALSASGKLQGVIDQGSVAALVQSVVSQMIDAGELPSTKTKPATSVLPPAGAQKIVITGFLTTAP